VAGIDRQQRDRYGCRCALEKVLREGGMAAKAFSKKPKADFERISGGARSQRLVRAVITESHT
jgi:hypothetical protein